MRGRAEHGSRWLQIVIAALVVAAAAFGIYHAAGRRPGKQDLDRSVDKMTSALGEALALRDRERSGQASPTYVATELGLLRKDLDGVSEKLAKAKPKTEVRLHYQRASRFAANAAKQVGALGSGAAPDSLDRTEARVRQMLLASKKLRTSGSAAEHP